MATIHICDRCGAEFFNYKPSEHNITIFDNPGGKSHDKYSQFDLCPECQQILSYFIEDFIGYCTNNEDILKLIHVDKDGNSTI